MRNIRIRAPSGLRSIALWTALGVMCVAPAPASAQGRDMGCSPTVANPCTGGSGAGSSGDYRGAEEAGRNARRWFDCNVLGKGCDQGSKPPSPGHTLNEQGVHAYKKGDWATAISYFERALQQEPNDPIIRKNLDNARANLASQQYREKAEREAMDQQRQNKAAVDNMQQSIQSFAQTLNAAPVSGGLDFDGRTAGAAPGGGGNGGGLDFTSAIAPAAKAKPVPPTDTSVVDARKLPSSLPKEVEDAIDGAYRNAPPGVGDRVRKGFQAVMDRDWKAAKAWFEDALNRDPDNVGLKRFVALADQTPLRNKQAAPPTAAPASAPRQPGPDDVYYYVPSSGYKLMSLEDATLRQLWDEMLGIPPGSIVNIR